MSTLYQAAVLADSPSVYYRLGESASPCVPDSGAGGVNLSSVGTLDFGEAGAFAGDSNKSVAFPGTATNYLQTVSSPGSAYDLGDGSFSIECWFKLNATVTLMDFLGKQGSGCYVLRIDATGKISLAASGVGNCFITTATVTDTNWHHLVVTRVAATQPILYLDGVSKAGTYTARTFSNSTSQFDLGRSGTANYFNGQLQDVALYKSVLSPTRVTAHYNTGINGVNGTAAMQVKKGSISVAGSSGGPVTGTAHVQAKKATIQATQSAKGTVLIHAKKATIAVIPRLVATVHIQAKKATIVSVPVTSGTAVVTTKKARIFASQKIAGTVTMSAKKPTIDAFRQSLITVRLNGKWKNALMWARVADSWVPCVAKIMVDGNWFTINFDEHGIVKNHVNVTCKKPTISAHSNLTLHGTVAMMMKRPVIAAKQSFVTTGTIIVQARRPTIKVQGKPAASSMLVGVNNYTGSPPTVTTWDDYVSVIPNCSVTRVYNQGSDGPNGIPSAWPHSSFTIVPAMQHLVVSIRPTDLSGFINGTYDAATKVWLRKIPAGQYITCYHEANLGANIFQTTLGGTAAQFRAMNQHLRDLAREVEAESTSNPKLNVGVIIGSANIGVDNTPWVPAGMDWYGMDGYGGAKSLLPDQRFGPNIAAITSVQPGAKMAIIENNDKTASDPARWNTWFTDAFQLALDNGMIIFMTWWGPTAQYPNAEIFNTSGTYVSTLHDLYASV